MCMLNKNMFYDSSAAFSSVTLFSSLIIIIIIIICPALFWLKQHLTDRQQTLHLLFSSVSQCLTVSYTSLLSPTFRTKHQTWGDRVFSIAAPSLCNSLPKQTCDCTNLTLFNKFLTASYNLYFLDFFIHKHY